MPPKITSIDGTVTANVTKRANQQYSQNVEDLTYFTDANVLGYAINTTHEDMLAKEDPKQREIEELKQDIAFLNIKYEEQKEKLKQANERLTV